MSRQEVTIREGTGEKNWYGLVVFVLAMALFISLNVYAGYEHNFEGGIQYFVGASAIVVLFLSIASHVALFKDSAYVRGILAGWKPKWWYYIGVPIIIGISTYPASNAIIQDEDVAIGFAILAYLLASGFSSAYYLYRRHVKVGVP